MERRREGEKEGGMWKGEEKVKRKVECGKDEGR